MDKTWTKRLKKAFIWLCGYLNFIAFAVVGGYTIIKGDEDCKDTSRKAFFAVLLFTAIDMFLSIFSGIGGLTDGWYSSSAYDFYTIFSVVVRILKILFFAFCICWTLFYPENSATKTEEPAKEEDTDIQ